MKNNNIRIMQKNITNENILDNTIQNEENKIPKTDNDNSAVSVNKYYDTPKNKLHLNNDLNTSKNTITPEEFESLAKTGDIILLKTKYIAAACKRLFTCGKYDHILFVYEKSGKITLLDASIEGICQGTDWKTFKNSLAHFVYDKIVYRRLNIDEKDIQKKKKIEDNFETNLKQFIKEVSNKHYYISIFSLICKGKPKEFEIKGEWEKAFGFSCSSFIAALYSKLGIIILENTVHSFLPGDFEKNNKLNFLPGFSLEPGKMLVFSRK